MKKVRIYSYGYIPGRDFETNNFNKIYTITRYISRAIDLYEDN